MHQQRTHQQLRQPQRQQPYDEHHHHHGVLEHCQSLERPWLGVEVECGEGDAFDGVIGEGTDRGR